MPDRANLGDLGLRLAADRPAELVAAGRLLDPGSGLPDPDFWGHLGRLGRGWRVGRAGGAGHSGRRGGGRHVSRVRLRIWRTGFGQGFSAPKLAENAAQDQNQFLANYSCVCRSALFNVYRKKLKANHGLARLELQVLVQVLKRA